MYVNNSAIHNKLEEIARVLVNRPPTSDVSLMSGDAGSGLFLLYYHKLKEEEIYLDRSLTLMDAMLSTVAEAGCLPTFAGGLAGMGWMLQHAVSQDFIDADIQLLLGKMDDTLYEWMMSEIEKGNYDFLHGATGAALYFLGKRSEDPRYAGYVANYISALEKQAITDPASGLRWPAFSFHNGTYGQVLANESDLGLSHGMPAIIAFLAKAGKAGIAEEQCRRMIEKSCRFLLHHIREPEKFNSYFGYRVNGHMDETVSRLAWCYGDLGICTTLWHAGVLLQQPLLQATALQIATFNAKRRDLADASIVDAGFCHGTCGVAHIYHKLYTWTQEPLFRDTALFWYEQTLALATYAEGPAGYQSYTSTDGVRCEWQNTYGMLEGIAGIGLSLITAVADFEPEWDEALLLSF